MRFTHLSLSNWKNFQTVEIDLERRAFIVGPNASGKSNLLDAFRFLRDIANPEGGFQRAVKSRGGVSQIRCLHARRYPAIAIAVDLEVENVRWYYRLGFTQDQQRNIRITKELVQRNGLEVLSRPNHDDQTDPDRLSQTHLEQVTANKEFREIADFLSQIRYLHIVPQLIRDTEQSQRKHFDPYGSDFLDQIASVSERTRISRLKRINQALRAAVPQFESLELQRDDHGRPHLRVLYKHWRPQSGWQTEEQFSDGTLRLIGLMWSIMDGTAPLLLEEPELSLHSEVVKSIPSMIVHAQRRSSRQIFLSTHSADLLADEGIALSEVIVLNPSESGTQVATAHSIEQVRSLVEGGLNIAEAIVSRTKPRNADQLAIAFD
ncbi:MAG TPA: AAA family ATPase [Candidatus Kapabacteria bacterium]|nr:AAA family ATPase [Candidatus Kapabacteria bacterium]